MNRPIESSSDEGFVSKLANNARHITNNDDDLSNQFFNLIRWPCNDQQGYFLGRITPTDTPNHSQPHQLVANARYSENSTRILPDMFQRMILIHQIQFFSHLKWMLYLTKVVCKTSSNIVRRMLKISQVNWVMFRSECWKSELHKQRGLIQHLRKSEQGKK